MSYPNKIILIGLMGAGKTTVGKILARHLGMRFIDTDHEIERRTGVKIPVIFELEGEEGFRARETAVLAQLCRMDNVVLATGGGAVLREENRKHLKRGGAIVYLRGQVSDLWHRTRHDKNRPLLQTADPQAKLRELFAQRDPIYRQLADIIMDTGNQNIQYLVRRLEQKLKDGQAPNMQTLTVELGDRAYPIHIGPGLLEPGRSGAAASGAEARR